MRAGRPVCLQPRRAGGMYASDSPTSTHHACCIQLLSTLRMASAGFAVVCPYPHIAHGTEPCFAPRACVFGPTGLRYGWPHSTPACRLPCVLGAAAAQAPAQAPLRASPTARPAATLTPRLRRSCACCRTTASCRSCWSSQGVCHQVSCGVEVGDGGGRAAGAGVRHPHARPDHASLSAPLQISHAHAHAHVHTRTPCSLGQLPPHKPCPPPLHRNHPTPIPQPPRNGASSSVVESYLVHTQLVGALVEDILRGMRVPPTSLPPLRKEVALALQACCDVAAGRWAKLLAARVDVHRCDVRGRRVAAWRCPRAPRQEDAVWDCSL